MAANQTFTFVALPNGTSAAGARRLSIYLTPRLAGASDLKSFPDMLDWPAQIRNRGLRLRISDGTHATTVAVDRTSLRPDIWKAIFTPQTPVQPFANPDFTKRLFVSYPSREVLAFLKYGYQLLTASVLEKTDDDREPILNTLLQPLVFRGDGISTLAGILAQLRVSLWRLQNSTDVVVGAGPGTTPAPSAAAAPMPPDGIPTTGEPPTNIRDAASRFALFHSMPPAYHRKPLPSTAQDFAKLLDFHKALTALSSFPSLLRALGLVFDVELPAASVQSSPTSGGSYANVFLEQVLPGFAWKIAPQLVLPQTAYYLAGGNFTAAPATSAQDLGSRNYVVGDAIDGFLSLAPADFHIAQIDVDGGMLGSLSLADAVAFSEFRNDANPSIPIEVEQTLPALRSGGISLMADGRAAQVLQLVRNNEGFDSALASGGGLSRPFNVLDLVRGYRIDIHSSKTNRWHSLHRRNSTYKFGVAGSPVLHIEDEEGFTQLAVAQPADDPTRPVDKVAKAAGAPQPGTDIFVHERVARWNGWSLSVQRPGRALNRSADPSKAVDPDPTLDEPVTPFKMTTSYTAVAGSLPQLRFGLRYRVRARIVDLAGNSVPLSLTSPDLALPDGTELPYLRFEPAPYPALALREILQQSASLDRLVIRSYNSSPALDKVATSEIDQRHIMPPRASVRMIERHAVLDDAQGRLKGDAATYNLIATRDAAQLPSLNGIPFISQALASVPYLPDPIARGAALRDLPNTRFDTNGAISGNRLVYAKSPQVEARAGSVTHISFGSAWPGRQPFRLIIAEGRKAPAWDAQARTLTVYLPKALEAEVPLSSYLDPGDLSLMGVWDWLRQYLEFAEIQSATNGGPVFPSNGIALLTQLTLEGGHPVITPQRTLNLVHAVQQPIGRPQFAILPIARPSGQSAALANAFSPITAWRQIDSHGCVLLGGLRVHGRSTSKVDIQASWREFIDDTSQPGPQELPATDHVEKIELGSLQNGIIYADSTQTRAVGTYISQGDMLWFSAPGDTIPGMSAPAVVAAPLHAFDDTKHRRIHYQAIATSRFQEYFPPTGLTFTRSSDSIVVNVPSSARPTAPDVRYVVPVFGLEQQVSTNVRSAVRFGSGVRVYLGRPWYSTGETELLGVLLWNTSANLDTPSREKYKNFITQWGLDPIWRTDFLSNSPQIADLSLAVASGQSLSLEETDLRVDVAGHCVFYDATRQLWYCDITFDNPLAYSPFVRMALARYQPHSLPGVELSHAVLADFVQLAPDRSAVLSIDPANPRTALLFVGGLVPEGPQPVSFEVTVEQRLANVYSDAGWETAPASVVTVVEDPPSSGNPDEVLWAGTITFARMPSPDQYRVIVREYETLTVDPTLIRRFPIVTQFGRRLVYAAIIPFDFPK